MWLLNKLNGESTLCLISDKHSYSVGRKNCDLVLENDSSISRKHCTIYVSKRSDCPFSVNTSTGIWVVDDQSKYGTYLQNNNTWVKLSPNQVKKLCQGNVVKFGLMENIWRLEYKPVIACVSGIPVEQRKKLDNILKSIDGELRNTLSKDCSAVIVNEITLTVKVVLSLINGIPIVTPTYVDKLLQCVKSQSVLPDYKDYRPVIKESMLDGTFISLDHKKTRKELFKGKTFIIPTQRQLETLSEIIESAGGKAELLSSNKLERLGEENVILIQIPFNNSIQSKESFKEILYLLKHKYEKRVIPECEIAQAVAYSSIEKYCNPKSTCFELRKGNKEQDSGTLLVEETPEVSKQQVIHPRVIPCSSTMDEEVNSVIDKSVTNRKRAHSPSKSETESQKKKVLQKDLVSEDAISLNYKSSVEKSDLQKNTTGVEKRNQDIGLNFQKAGPSKSQQITNFFKKQNKTEKESSQIEKIGQGNQTPTKEKIAPRLVEGGDFDDFWLCDSIAVNKSMKRKLSTENDLNNHYQQKKGKFSMKYNPPSQEKTVSETKELEEQEQLINKLSAKISANPEITARTIQETEKNNLDFTDFISKEKREFIDTSNDIFSYKIITSAYLKKSGSLIEPPSYLVNAKKFKKQKVLTVPHDIPVDETLRDTLSDDWLEPHPLRLGVSVTEK